MQTFLRKKTKLIDNQLFKFIDMDVVANIKKIRIEKGLKQEVLAEALNIDVSNYSRMESGKHDLKVSQLVHIANALHVSIIDLFTYPEKYVNKNMFPNYDKVSVTFEVSPENREILIGMINKTEQNNGK